uniref:Axonemal dynein light chain domain containing 1 n=1 Tax=Anser brachyrhynchus TaxID=132585 RepID=A0A8B9CBR7_9AVES
MLDHMRPVSSSLEYSFVPEEIFRTLTCASSSLSSPEYLKSHQTGCLQTPDRLWHYPNRRSKFRHLTDHPVSLTCAGSFNIYTCFSKYTTLLEDHEKKLRLFPSMKPAGRLEVIQLMEAMDNMLEKAGVDELIRVTGPSQLHNMLELLKAEQNIYNIVFHELIRQVSVDCVERGHLLSKLRSSLRYVDLLERIPQQMKTLYKKMMAQRLLDRHITKELLYFKESVEQLTRSESCLILNNYLNVLEMCAHTSLSFSSSLLEQYRELYELQRRRLEDQVLLVAQERDIWSSAAYDLALKIIDRNQLTLVRRLDVSGKTLTKVLKHFIVLLASKDTRDLADLQEEAEQFREMLGRVGAEIEHLEESSKEKLQIVCRSLNKWLQYRDSNFCTFFGR